MLNIFKANAPNLHSVMFVCTANITRSPSAEGMFRDLIAKKSSKKWEITSAGVKAYKGSPAERVVSNRLYNRGIPLNNHHSKPVTKKLLNKYYWIIVMEMAHKETILKIDPELKDRVFTLREFGLDSPPENPDMPDPTGKEIEDFRELFEILDYEIPRFAKLVELRVEDLSWENENF